MKLSQTLILSVLISLVLLNVSTSLKMKTQTQTKWLKFCLVKNDNDDCTKYEGGLICVAYKEKKEGMCMIAGTEPGNIANKAIKAADVLAQTKKLILEAAFQKYIKDKFLKPNKAPAVKIKESDKEASKKLKTEEFVKDYELNIRSELFRLVNIESLKGITPSKIDIEAAKNQDFKLNSVINNDILEVIDIELIKAIQNDSLKPEVIKAMSPENKVKAGIIKAIPK
jgi:hypothetical protein